MRVRTPSTAEPAQRLVVWTSLQPTCGVLQASVAVTEGRQCGIVDSSGLQPRKLVTPQVAKGCCVNTGATVSSVQVTTCVQVVVLLQASMAVQVFVRV